MNTENGSEFYRINVDCTGVYRGHSESSPLETEALFGELVQVYGFKDEWAQVTTVLDSYPGYIQKRDLLMEAGSVAPTHMVSEPKIAVFPKPSFKSATAEDRALYMNSRVVVIEEQDTPQGVMLHIYGVGWVFMDQLRAIDSCAPDYVTEAVKFLGTTYKWGYRSRGFVDCSSLVQAACIAAGISCPRDVSQQVQSLGAPIDFALDFSGLVPGDLVFWTKDKGSHVAIMVDPVNCLHATTAPPYRKTLMQPLGKVAADQKRDGNGPVTTIRRFPDYRS